jgi:hypothetical protein
MIYVPWGGPSDFAEKEDLALQYNLVSVHPGYRWPERTAQWAAPLMKSLVESMQTVEVKAERRVPYGFEYRFSLWSVANKIQQRLRALWPLQEFQL